MKKDNWFVKNLINPWFTGMVVFSFLGVGSLMQIDSYWADKHHFNGIFGWLGIGIVSLLTALYCAKKVNDTSTGTGG